MLHRIAGAHAHRCVARREMRSPLFLFVSSFLRTARFRIPDEAGRVNPKRSSEGIGLRQHTNTRPDPPA